jgi:hypothetical protein
MDGVAKIDAELWERKLRPILDLSGAALAAAAAAATAYESHICIPVARWVLHSFES